MEEIKKFSTKQLVEELLCREEVIIMPDTKEEVHFMCAEKGMNKGDEKGGNSGSEKAVIGLWKNIILSAI